MSNSRYINRLKTFMDFEVKIRMIDRTDFEFIYNSICDLQSQIFEPKKLEQIFNENIDNPNYLYLIAETDQEKVGFITFHTQNLLHHNGLVGEIQEFYIIPDFRGKGIGRQLIDKVFEFAKKRQLTSIEVTTGKKRKENIAIYENFGFGLTHNKFTIYR